MGERSGKQRGTTKLKQSPYLLGKQMIDRGVFWELEHGDVVCFVAIEPAKDGSARYRGKVLVGGAVYPYRGPIRRKAQTAANDLRAYMIKLLDDVRDFFV